MPWFGSLGGFKGVRKALKALGFRVQGRVQKVRRKLYGNRAV